VLRGQLQGHRGALVAGEAAAAVEAIRVRGRPIRVVQLLVVLVVLMVVESVVACAHGNTAPHFCARGTTKQVVFPADDPSSTCLAVAYLPCTCQRGPQHPEAWHCGVLP
jgi:hypothetical protein